MKKLLTLTLLFTAISFFCQNINAQSTYEKSIEIGGSVGVDGVYNNNSFDVIMINGIRLNKTLYAGFGTGLSIINALYYKNYTYYTVGNSESYESRSTEFTIPLFARLKFNLTNETHVSPFLMANIGYVFDPSKNTTPSYGLMIEPDFGLDFNLKDNMILYAMIGLHFQHGEYTFFSTGGSSYPEVELKSALTSAIAIRCGIKF